MWMVGIWKTDELRSGDDPFELTEHATEQSAERKVAALVEIFRGFRYQMKREKKPLCWSGRSAGGREIFIQAIENESP